MKKAIAHQAGRCGLIGDGKTEFSQLLLVLTPMQMPKITFQKPREM